MWRTVPRPSPCARNRWKPSTAPSAYYRSAYEEGSNRTPKFLWNAKMRFGKTFASYELAKKMGFKRVLILTFKPAVQTAWREDLMSHVDFEGWQFISRDANNLQDTINDQYQRADKTGPSSALAPSRIFSASQRDRRHQGQQ